MSVVDEYVGVTGECVSVADEYVGVTGECVRCW